MRLVERRHSLDVLIDNHNQANDAADDKLLRLHQICVVATQFQFECLGSAAFNDDVELDRWLDRIEVTISSIGYNIPQHTHRARLLLWTANVVSYLSNAIIYQRIGAVELERKTDWLIELRAETLWRRSPVA